jgi:hypothetical protein
MKTLDAPPTISEEASSLIHTGATEAPSLTNAAQDRARREAWQQIIDYKLVEWGRDPSQFADDGLEPPSNVAIQWACLIAKYLRATGQAPPQRVVPNGEGGIVFEHSGEGWFQKVEIGADGSAEALIFHNGRLCSRTALR